MFDDLLDAPPAAPAAGGGAVAAAVVRAPRNRAGVHHSATSIGRLRLLRLGFIKSRVKLLEAACRV